MHLFVRRYKKLIGFLPHTELFEAEAGTVSPSGERLRVTSHADGEEELESGS